MKLSGQLKALANETTRSHNAKYGAGDNQFGVKHDDIRLLAKKIKTNPELAMSLWETGNLDAQLLATLLIKPKTLSAQDVDRMVRSVTFAHVADWLHSYVVKHYNTVEKLFAAIRRSLSFGKYRMLVQYHDALGYPVIADLDPKGDVIDDELVLKVTEFRATGVPGAQPDNVPGREWPMEPGRCGASAPRNADRRAADRRSGSP